MEGCGARTRGLNDLGAGGSQLMAEVCSVGAPRGLCRFCSSSFSGFSMRKPWAGAALRVDPAWGRSLGCSHPEGPCQRLGWTGLAEQAMCGDQHMCTGLGLLSNRPKMATASTLHVLCSFPAHLELCVPSRFLSTAWLLWTGGAPVPQQYVWQEGRFLDGACFLWRGV